MKPMTLNEIAIQDELQQQADRVARLVVERDAARTELAQAQARIAELTAERDAARAERDAAKTYQRMAARR